MYLPVLREKLGRLENRGRAGSDEAIRLRKAISRVETAVPAAAPDSAKIHEAA